MTPFLRHLAAAALFAGATVTTAGTAHAQAGIPNAVNPGSTDQSGGVPPPPAPPAPAGSGVSMPAAGGAAPAAGGDNAGAAGAAAGGGIYFSDDTGAADTGSADDEGDARFRGPTPDMHVVRSGDTLWDICRYYFNNPWDWPKVWSYNPTITNPHWIYPGDLVRLYPAGQGPVAEPTGDGDADNGLASARVAPGQPTGAAPPTRNASLRQIAFVDDEELKYAGTIIGSPEEKIMLTPGDEVYLDYPEGRPPQIGQRYAIYSDAETINHPETKQRVGAYITLHGEVRITEVKKGRKARAMLTYATDVIERGMRVGPTRTQFKEVASVAPERDLEGVIIAILSTDQLVGDQQVIFIDRGATDGLKPGNRMRVLRRGDAYKTKMGPGGNAGQDDRQFPDDTIGQIVVVEVGKKSSIAFVTGVQHEIEIGDHVMMRRQN